MLCLGEGGSEKFENFKCIQQILIAILSLNVLEGNLT